MSLNRYQVPASRDFDYQESAYLVNISSSILAEKVETGRRLQCDTMVRLFIQYLAVYIKENWPNSNNISQIRFEFFQLLNEPLKCYQRYLKSRQIGQILLNLVTLKQSFISKKTSPGENRFYFCFRIIELCCNHFNPARHLKLEVEVGKYIRPRAPG